MHASIPLIVSTLALQSAAAPKLFRRWEYECPEGSCSFTLSVDGKPVDFNPVDDHQVAYGGEEPGAEITFCINEEGQVTDSAGICGITQNTGDDEETSQFQCDASSSSKFTINCEGYLEYDGSPWFYGCLASDAIGYNIYATPPSENQCASGEPSKIMLKASGCYKPCEEEKPECPAELEGEWQFPHLIIPISKESPEEAAGTSYDGKVNSMTSSIFNFDVPESYKGMQCKVMFDFPMQSQLVTSSYTLSGSGMVDFSKMSMAATESTTWDNAPSVMKNLGMKTLAPGNAYTVWEGECPAGEACAFMMSTMSTTELWWFQDYNQCPIGLYMMASN